MRAQQLDRRAGTVADTAVLDQGVQDTGTDGARWALALRGVDPATVGRDELALAWTLRGAPHLYRRADLPAVAAATAPFSEADAGKRIYDAAKPLRAAGISVVDALDRIADRMREIVSAPTVKGEVSARLTAVLEPPYLRDCVPCGAVHPWEMPFRLAALRAGLELEEGTSPPVLRPVDGLVPAGAAPRRFDVVHGSLQLLGPATPQHVAGLLDAPVADVKARWPHDAVEVDVEGERRWLLAEDADRLDDDVPEGVRLLGPYDLFLQGRDRALVVPDAARAKDLWRTLGRPGAVLADSELAGTWRARKAGRQLTVTVQAWQPLPPGLRERIGEQAERLAAFRGLSLRALELVD